VQLTDDQIQAFGNNGYHLFGALLDSAQAEELAAVYMDCVKNHQGGHPSQQVNKIRHSETKEGKERLFYQLRCAHLMHPAFDALVRNERLLDAVESLIGPNLRIVICQGMYKPPHGGDEIRWHQDDYYFQVDKPDAVVSCWLTLDDATVDNGCMWVIPGAHKQLIEHQTVPSGTGYHIADMDETQALPVELKRGHCMLHHGLMPHRTLAKSTSRHRRALAIHYMDASAKPNQARQQEPPENMPVVRGRGVAW
jgi:ectoine hydroxylase-related dioxygenase (phytanoyl-CoA dioxygenase family)